MRQGLRISGWMLLAVVIAFAALFWPQSLGGKVAYVRVDGHSMDPTFHMGDLAIVRKQPSYQIGDPVAYRIPKGEFGAGAMVIHRLVGGNGETGYITKGDNRNIKDEWHPRTSDVVGRVRYDIPAAGDRIATFTKPMYLGGLVAGLTVLVMLIPSKPKPTRVRPTGLAQENGLDYPNESSSSPHSGRHLINHS